FSKEMDAHRLPPEGTPITCPRCAGRFPLHRGDHTSPLSAPPADALPAAASPPQPAPRPERPPRRTLSFSFTGSAREYFGIWIVNTLLRVVTLGLYSPWAKVRKRRYFYGNTLLDDAPFDYLADPLAILRGWILAGLFFGLYSYASKVSPLLSLGLGLLIFALSPWVIVRSRIFNMRNSTYRNIRFGFAPVYSEAYRVFLWWQLLIPFTLGALAPYVIWRQKRFMVENSLYGSTPFGFHAGPREYYRIFLRVGLAFALCAAVFGASVFLAVKGSSMGALLSLLSIVSFLALYFLAGIYIPTELTNLTWNSTSLGDHRFRCSLRFTDLAWIYVSNGMAVICTLGLLAPWGAVRLARYRLEKLTLSGAGGLESVAAGAQVQVGAAGEELGDMLGFDLGL
ncbi:MAG TPA: YjgN family protein, partial [Verrucomicrobiae bacterium]|nr:YjgN family protein [Verrucomicrobiae bacterium]